MRVTVYGLGHQGVVAAACLAAAGHSVVGLDDDDQRAAALGEAHPREHEPGLADRLREAVRLGRLRFTTDAADALRDCEVLWLGFDTPLAADDTPQTGWVQARLDAVAPALPRGTLVVVSAQVPAGFVGQAESRWSGRGLRFACVPENLRVGAAVRSFEEPDRVVAGVRGEDDRRRVEALLAPLHCAIEWMSPESAEMTKHALNAWLATSVAFMNEVARLCEATGASVDEVARGLRSDARIGERPYFTAGAPFSGGTLARDLRALGGIASRRGVDAPLVAAVLASNAGHQRWALDAVRAELRGAAAPPVAAVLGLAYKPGTEVLRRSAAVELALALADEGAEVRAHDPAVRALPETVGARVRLCADPAAALDGADAAIIATAWAEYAALEADDLARWMRRPCVVDPSGLLAGRLAGDPRVRYRAPGRSSAEGA